MAAKGPNSYSKPWRKKSSGTKGKLTPLQDLRRVALFEVYVAHEILETRLEALKQPDIRGAPTSAAAGGLLGALEEADRCVSRLRQLATNREDGCTMEVLQSVVDEVRAAMETAGLGALFSKALVREEPGRFDLIAKVLPGLWIGGWAALNNDAFVLRQKKVTHVLSVHSAEQQRSLPPFIRGRMNVNVEDKDEADLLTHFPAMCEFIASGRSEGGIVYVHCGAGIR
mmetsp:Transcript_58580/g.132612  ORF Transcript_58580/g.132612 Transcript_58580/m.132612 type:complete len:227 (+) Transcript_58580:112-792(+)